MTQIVIYGASGFGREVAWLVESCSAQGTNYEPVCFIDDNEQKQGRVFNKIPVMSLGEAKKAYPQAFFVSGIGNPQIREKTVIKAKEAGFSFASMIHPRVEMSRWVQIGEGAVICAGNILTTNIVLGQQVQINLDCTIGHDVVMGDYTTLAPGVHVSGRVHFGKRVYVGRGAVLINGTEENPLQIGDDVVIGAGACVARSIEHGTWGGCQPGSLKKSDREKSGGYTGHGPFEHDRFSGWQYPVIEDGKLTAYNWMVQHKEHLQLGYKTDIGAFTYINAKHGVIIEDYVQLGSHCSVYSISTIDDKTGHVQLKQNCRIGTHSTIMPGVTVGENAVVGAHSFVNKDVPAGTIVAGIPALPITGQTKKR
jgi:sugar O-acyltransferase (sialic acid O-acetyltransferase NeuD family)